MRQDGRVLQWGIARKQIRRVTVVQTSDTPRVNLYGQGVIYDNVLRQQYLLGSTFTPGEGTPIVVGRKPVTGNYASPVFIQPVHKIKAPLNHTFTCESSHGRGRSCWSKRF